MKTFKKLLYVGGSVIAALQMTLGSYLFLKNKVFNEREKYIATHPTMEYCETQYNSCLNEKAEFLKNSNKVFIVGDIEECTDKYLKCKEEAEIWETFKYYNEIFNRNKIREEKEISDKENIKEYLSQLEKELGFKENFLIKTAYIESNFRYDIVSNKKAYGLMQIKKQSFDELKRLYALSKYYVDRYVEKDSLSHVDIRNPYTFEFIKVKDEGIDKKLLRDIKYYYTPLFLALDSHKGVLNKTWKEVALNPKHNALIGALYMYAIKTDIGTLQLIRDGKKYRLVRRSPYHFVGREHLKIVPDSHEKYLWVIYNMGITKFKRKIQRHDHLWEVLRHLPRETRKGVSKLRKISTTKISPSSSYFL